MDINVVHVVNKTKKLQVKVSLVYCFSAASARCFIFNRNRCAFGQLTTDASSPFSW